MKNYKFLYILFLASFIWACKEEGLQAPEFDVTVEKNTFKKNENVVFTITGVPDNISFYSGEPGRVYATKDSLTGAGAINRLHFTTQVGNLPAGNVGQTNNLRVFVSNDFNGQVNGTAIRQATWTDITSRLQLATNATAKLSDTVNVSDFRTSRDTLYVALRYLSTVSSNASRARQWTMSKFIFQNKFPNGTLFTHSTVDTDNRLSGFNAYSFPVASSLKDSLVWNNGQTALFPQGINGYSDEDWLISKPFRLSSRNPDKGVGIKKSSVRLDSYTYKFTKPGVYNVTFAANNASDEGIKEVIKQITLTITD